MAWIGISLYNVFGRREKYEKDSDEKERNEEESNNSALLQTKFDPKKHRQNFRLSPNILEFELFDIKKRRLFVISFMGE